MKKILNLFSASIFAFASLSAQNPTAKPSGKEAAKPTTQVSDEIVIKSTKRRQIPLALLACQGSASKAPEYQDIFINNFNRSGFFEVLAPTSYPFPSLAMTATMDPKSWAAIGAHIILICEVNQSDKLNLSYRIFDVINKKELARNTLSIAENHWRRLAHIASDDLYQKVLGKKGFFDSRILFVDEQIQNGQKSKTIAISDQDGGNYKTLTDGKALVISPKLSPDGKEIVFLSYLNNNPRIYLFNIQNGQEEELPDFGSISFAPIFSPDGQKLYYNKAIAGNSEIYAYDRNTKQETRLTNNPGIDTGPTASPDGQKLAFESDRAGGSHIFIMKSNGKGVDQITFGSAEYHTPAWSPDGQWIAFTKLESGTFSIGIMKTDGSNERILKTDYLVEGPTWSPNTQFIIYFRQDASTKGERGKTYLEMIDINTKRTIAVATPHDASDPSWGQLQH